jgi:CRP-like cAMP-binding protein
MWRGGPDRVRTVVAAVAVSGFGTWSYNVGVAVYAYDKTHSTAWVAAVTVGRYIPALILSWLASRLVDRMPRRALVVGSDLACAAVMAVLWAMGLTGAPVWAVTVVAAISSTTARVQAAAILSLGADVIVESQLARASILTAGAEAVATAAGSAAASALLLVVSPAVLFLINAATFAASAALVATLPAVTARRMPAARRTERGRFPPRVWRREFWPFQLSRLVVACVYGVDVVLLTVVAARQFGRGTAGYGWLLAAAGVGGLLAIGAARRGVGARHTAAWVTMGVAVYSVPLLVFAIAPPFGGDLVVQVVRGVGCVLATSSIIGGLQRRVPSAVSGRVFGTTQSLVLIGTCVGALATPVLLDNVGFRATVIAAAVVPVLAQLAIHPFLERTLREDQSVLAALDPHLSTLRGLDLLRDASRATLYDVANALDEMRALAGTPIVREGDAADALYVLVSGRVEVTTRSNGSDQAIRRLAAPDYFGEIGLLRGVPRTATVTAVEDCELWRVPGDRFLRAVAEAGVSGALTDTVRIRLDTSSASSADYWS